MNSISINSAIYALMELKKASRGFDWGNQTVAAQNALICAIATAVAHGEALNEERKQAKKNRRKS